MPREKTRGGQVADWIQNYCVTLTAPDRGKRVRLTATQRDVIHRIYDPPPHDIPVNDRELAAYLALACLASPEAVGENTFRPQLLTIIARGAAARR